MPLNGSLRNRARKLPVPHGRVPGEHCQHQRRLLQVLLAHALVEIRVRVMRADVVITIVLEGCERRNPHRGEGEMIRVNTKTGEYVERVKE